MKNFQELSLEEMNVIKGGIDILDWKDDCIIGILSTNTKG